MTEDIYRRFVKAIKARICKIDADASKRINRVGVFDPATGVRLKSYDEALTGANDRSAARQRELPPPA